jgi:hypothetical protein
MSDKRFKLFYSCIYITALLPYLGDVIPFLPSQVFGFNWTGWAWMLMLMVTGYQLMSMREFCKITFPIWAWLPWILYMLVHIAYRSTYLGLQLTAQYLLPLLVGVMASGYSYSEQKLRWLFKWFIRLCMAVVGMSIYGMLFRGGWIPVSAATPMLLSIAASLMLTLYFVTKEVKYIVYFGLFFLVPVIELTRMGIAVFLVLVVFHFANRDKASIVMAGLVSLALLIVIFNSSRFQEKTFFEGEGSYTDLQLNYYESEALNTNGRVTWKKALTPGLRAAPYFGNGPRADYGAIEEYVGSRGETHNDFLSVSYCYGYVGLSLLLFGFASSFMLLLRWLRQCPNVWGYILVTSTLSLFIPFLMFMYSDNILKYTIFFPNIFFAMIGISSSMRKHGIETNDELQ